MLLSILVFFPLLLALVHWTVVPEKYQRPVAFLGASIEFGLCLYMLSLFDPSLSGLQMTEEMSWIPSLGVSYGLGVDGISLWLVVLTGFLQIFLVSGSWECTKKKSYQALLFFLQSAMMGTFLATDAILFYLFFEASLVPMYFLVGLWGGKNRVYASYKLFIFTMTGSLLILGSLLALINLSPEVTGGVVSARIFDFYKLSLPFIGGHLFNTQTLIFLCLSIGFAVKVPLAPFHTWLPDAHVEAPTPGSVVLAGVMLKMGVYGFLRFVLPICGEAVAYWSWVLIFLSLFGIVYGALVAMVQSDIKKLVAYSSVSHMGYTMLGVFSLTTLGLSGGYYQMLAHAISTGGLFLLVGMIYDKVHTREIDHFGGLAIVAPIFSIFFFIMTLSSIAVPLTAGFVGEFLILMGAFEAYPFYAVVGSLGVVLGAWYMLWCFKKVFLGPVSSNYEKISGTLDMSSKDILFMIPFAALIFIMGVFPNIFLSYSKSSLEGLLKTPGSYQTRALKFDEAKPSHYVLKNASKNSPQDTLQKRSEP